MKPKTVFPLAFAILLLFPGLQDIQGGKADDPSPRGCSVFTLAKDSQVFFGGNDDYLEPDSYYWVDPGDSTRYGVIWIGQPDNVQQGVNEMGLAYDANGLPRVDVNPHAERLPVSGSYNSYPIHIMHACATVEEVITWIEAHRWHSFMHDQMQFADAGGDAVIISAGSDGEVVFTRKEPGDGFLVSTNFNVANPSNGFGYPCWRYERASVLLDELAREEGELSVEQVAGVLDAIHQQGVSSWTIGSMLADLPHGLVYVYFFWQFDSPVVLDVRQELSHPRPPGALSQLFPEEVREEARRRHQEIASMSWRCQLMAIAWVALTALSLILFLLVPALRRHGSRLWLPALVVLGPLALLALLLTALKGAHRHWRLALRETAGDLTPTVVAYVLFLCLLLMVPGAQASRPLQLFMIFLFPFLLGWLAFNGPLLGNSYHEGPGRMLVQRIPHVLAAANLGMGGINLLAMPMGRYSIQNCPVFPPSGMSVIIWWAVVGVGALAGALLLFPFEYWAAKKGSRAWSAVSTKDISMNTLPWKKAWWWVVISYVLLLAGIAAGMATAMEP